MAMSIYYKGYSLIKQNLQILANSHTLDDFICMKTGKGPGIVYDLLHFVQAFYKVPDHTKTQN